MVSKVLLEMFFYNLGGPNAAIFSIVAISSAMKYYLDQKSINIPIFADISKMFVLEIAEECATNNDAVDSMVKNISSISLTFGDRITIAKKNFGECKEIELYGIAAASLYCNFQNDTIDMGDEPILETYFEIFKTAFIKLVESL